MATGHRHHAGGGQRREADTADRLPPRGSGVRPSPTRTPAPADLGEGGGGIGTGQGRYGPGSSLPGESQGLEKQRGAPSAGGAPRGTCKLFRVTGAGEACSRQPGWTAPAGPPPARRRRAAGSRQYGHWALGRRRYGWWHGRRS